MVFEFYQNLRCTIDIIVYDLFLKTFNLTDNGVTAHYKTVNNDDALKVTFVHKNVQFN